MPLLSIRLRAEQLKALEKLAKENHLSVGWFIRLAIDEFLKQNEPPPTRQTKKEKR
jgi:predicted transcriptional regulator